MLLVQIFFFCNHLKLRNKDIFPVIELINKKQVINWDKADTVIVLISIIAAQKYMFM